MRLSELLAKEDAALLTDLLAHEPDAIALLEKAAGRAGEPPQAVPLLEALVRNLGDAADPSLAALNLERWSARLATPASTLGFLVVHPRLLGDLLTLLGASRYLADVLVREPGLHALLAGEASFRSTEEHNRELERMIHGMPGAEERGGALRRHRRREFLRIGWLDLCRGAALEDVTSAISDLADALVQQALAAARDELRGRFGRAADEVQFGVIAMGKLGARELNYSSDIDLIFLSDGPHPVPDLHRTYLSRLGERLIHLLSARTGEGFCFRVDMRLRPEGRGGPLVRSLASFRDYYDRWAEGWERQAMIKARPNAGDPSLGAAFLELIQPVVYRPPRAASIVEEVSEMRAMTQQQLARAGQLERNVKSGIGAIRDVEFTVQLLQMLFGHKIEALQVRDTLTALDRLEEHGLLGADERRDFEAGYRFFRVVEHHLQLLDDSPVRQAPSESRDLNRLARSLGFSGAGEFDAAFSRHSEAIQKRAADVLDRLGAGAGTSDPLRTAVLSMEGAAGLELAVRELHRLDFPEPDRAAPGLAKLASGPIDYPLPIATRRLFADLAPLLLESCREAADPAGALAGVSEMGERVLFHRGFYQSLLENKAARRATVLMAGSAPRVFRLIIRHPEFLESVTDEAFRTQRFAREQYGREIDKRLAGAAAARRWDVLRQVRQREEVRLAGQMVLDGRDAGDIARDWSELADALVEAALTEALESPEQLTSAFAVFALGRYGGRSLHFASDLDLVYIFDSGRMAPEEAARVGRVLTEILESSQSRGRLFRVDLRLRPEGRGGQQVFSHQAAQRYYGDGGRAESWEFQMLTRLRFVAGDAEAAAAAMELLRPRIYRNPMPPEWKREIATMKSRIERERSPGASHLKLGPGGFADIEFLTQFLQLEHGARLKELRTADLSAALHVLTDRTILSQNERDLLLGAIEWLTRLRQSLYLLSEGDSDELPRSDSELAVRLARLVGVESSEALLGRRRSEGDKVRALLRRHLPSAWEE